MIAPRTLFGKLLALFLAFGAVMTGVFVLMMDVAHERYHLEFDQIINRGLAQKYVADSLLVAEPPLTARKLTEALRRITAINPNVNAYVLDGRGLILAASTAAGEREVVRTRVDIEPISRFLSGRATFPLLDSVPTSARSRGVFSAAPLSIPGSSAAYLYLVLNRQDDGPLAERLQTTYDLGEDAGIILVAAVLAIAATVVFLRMLTGRLHVLQQDIEHFRDEQLVTRRPAGGSCESESKAESSDEIGRLRRDFSHLAERIREQTRELAKSDDILRELLANVSHDLRTPLTTLQMQLETLSLKGDLPEEDRRERLAVALQQSRRLGTLTGQLLELAQLDAGQVAYSPEPFQLADLAQDMVLAYELKARKARVALTLGPPAGELPLVMGDIALVGRVLDILLENAIRHAGANGRVDRKSVV